MSEHERPIGPPLPVTSQRDLGDGRVEVTVDVPEDHPVAELIRPDPRHFSIDEAAEAFPVCCYPVRAHTERSPLLIVAESYQVASHVARELGLAPRTWTSVTDIDQAIRRASGRIDGRYITAGLLPYWYDEIIAILHARDFKRDD